MQADQLIYSGEKRVGTQRMGLKANCGNLLLLDWPKFMAFRYPNNNVILNFQWTFVVLVHEILFVRSHLISLALAISETNPIDLGNFLCRHNHSKRFLWPFNQVYIDIMIK